MEIQLEMRILVVYGTRFGNTERIARAIAEGLSSRSTVQTLSLDEASESAISEADLLVIGGPTENHRLTTPVKRFLEQLQPGALRSVSVAAFDTRYRKPRWYSGSAAGGISRMLRRAEALELVPPESFFVRGRPAELEHGERERARAWADALAEKLEVTRATASSTH
jgi:flavodoxin